MRMPSNLEDAARIDGCSTFQIWAKIFCRCLGLR